MNDRRRKGLEKEISNIIGMTILTEVKNDRIKDLVTVQNVEMSKDGSYIDLFFSVLDLKASVNKETLLDDLNKLKGFFRKKIGSSLSLRHVPEVRVHLDDSIEHGIRISAIIDELKNKN